MDKGSKDIFVTIRVDHYTFQAIEELMKVLKTRNRSKVVRVAIWFLVLLTSPNTTLRKLLKPESIEKLASGGDEAFIDSIKSFSDLLKEITR